MEVVPNTYEVEDGVFPFCIGKITIDDFWETFEMALNYWSVEDYERQWREGLERIKNYDTSCLVASIHDPAKRHYLLWWPLYKEGGKVLIQNYLFVDELYIKNIGDRSFTVENCYEFIPPKKMLTEEGNKISTWIVDLEP